MAGMIRQHDPQEGDPLLASINTTPLVDVMLVLLIIFLITIPVVTHTVPVQLPKESSQPNPTPPQTIHLSVDQQGVLYWDQAPLNLDRLKQRLEQRAHDPVPPVVQIRGDQRARFDAIGRILAVCQQVGIHRVGFITEPPAAP